MSRRTRAWLAPLAALALVVGPGCGALLEGPTANRCETDGDCPTGSCAVELGMCVTDTRESITLGIEVLPAASMSGGTATLVSFPAFDLTGPVTLDEPLILPSSVRASGIVRDTSTGDAVTATVTFNLRSAFQGGQSARITAQTRDEIAPDSAGRPSNLTVGLLPGRDYDVTVTPNGAWSSRRPPLRIGALYRSPSGSEGTYLDFLSYPDFCSSATMAAPPADADCLVEMFGTVVDTEGAPQDGMLVRVLSEETGQVVSSTHTTGSDPEAAPGTFRVVLPIQRWLGGWLYSVTPDAARIEADGPSPTFTADPASLFEEIDGEGRRVVTILTPDVSNVVTYAGWVEARATATRLANATLSFSATDVVDSSTGVVGSFRTSAVTGTGDDAGRFEVQLLPGEYEVVVTPDATANPDLRILRQTVEFGPEASGEIRGQLFSVPARAPYGGLVQTTGGIGIADAQVRARPRGVDWMGMLGPVATLARSSTTVTDPDGRFGLSLDVGVFDVVVEPPSGSNYPWLVVPDQAIGGSDAPLTNVFELDAPVTVSGVASFDGTTPAANAEVRAYAIVESTDTTTRAIQIGRAETDAEGAFTLLLPPSI